MDSKLHPVSDFLKTNFRHYNAGTLVDAAEGYKKHLERGGKMFVTLAGAMSTAELGISLAEMIRKGKIHGISCTGANLEEDVFNLVAHEHYERIPNWRDLSPKDEEKLLKKHLNRVTDTCIPEGEAVRRMEGALMEVWQDADKKGESYFPYQYFYKVLLSGRLKNFYQIDPKNSWLLAAAERDIPMFVPGWEDSTMGNIFAARCYEKKIKNVTTMKLGIQSMMALIDWYTKTTKSCSLGFFQIGGGIAGDFPICVVPLARQDLERDVPLWGYFCQISDAVTSYGGYSGAIPNEKITWEKLSVDTPKFMIESDATICAPLIFAYVLGL